MNDTMTWFNLQAIMLTILTLCPPKVIPQVITKITSLRELFDLEVRSCRIDYDHCIDGYKYYIKNTTDQVEIELSCATDEVVFVTSITYMMVSNSSDYCLGQADCSRVAVGDQCICCDYKTLINETGQKPNSSEQRGHGCNGTIRECILDIEWYDFAYEECPTLGVPGFNCSITPGNCYSRRVTVEYECRKLVVSLTAGWQGRVEVTVGNEVGTVCDNNWNNKDCKAVCRELEYSGGKSRAGEYYGKGIGRVWLNNVNCSRSNDHLYECEHDGWGVADGCDHSNDAGCKCNDPVRGLGSYSLYLTAGWQGRVEVTYAGAVGTVCGNKWGDTDCQVVCRELGYSGGKESGDYGQGSGRIWLNKVNCNGSEHHLHECKHDGWGVYECDHTQDAGCRCDEPELGHRVTSNFYLHEKNSFCGNFIQNFTTSSLHECARRCDAGSTCVGFSYSWNWSTNCYLVDATCESNQHENSFMFYKELSTETTTMISRSTTQHTTHHTVDQTAITSDDPRGSISATTLQEQKGGSITGFAVGISVAVLAFTGFVTGIVVFVFLRRRRIDRKNNADTEMTEKTCNSGNIVDAGQDSEENNYCDIQGISDHSEIRNSKGLTENPYYEGHPVDSNNLHFAGHQNGNLKMHAKNKDFSKSINNNRITTGEHEDYYCVIPEGGENPDQTLTENTYYEGIPVTNNLDSTGTEVSCSPVNPEYQGLDPVQNDKVDECTRQYTELTQTVDEQSNHAFEMEDRSKLKSENILTKVPITENNLPSPPDGNDYLLIREVNTEIPEQMTENTYYTSNEAVLDKKGVIDEEEAADSGVHQGCNPDIIQNSDQLTENTYYSGTRSPHNIPQRPEKGKNQVASPSTTESEKEGNYVYTYGHFKLEGRSREPNTNNL